MKRDTVNRDLGHKLAGLNAYLGSVAQKGHIALAFSGGLDSRFLAHAAVRAGLRPVLLHGEGPHIAGRESRYAREWTARNGMDLRILKADPLTVPEVAANDRMRCYHCKKALFSKLLPAAEGLPLCDGTQASDSGAYRPGRVALTELEILSPLAQAGLTKQEIRVLAKQTGMENPGQKARPCLLTRFAYQLPPQRALLAVLDRAEQNIDGVLRDILAAAEDAELPDFRLRFLDRGMLELHLTAVAGSGESLPGAVAAALVESIRSDTGIAPAAIRVMPRLSGFFDRE